MFVRCTNPQTWPARQPSGSDATSPRPMKFLTGQASTGGSRTVIVLSLLSLSPKGKKRNGNRRQKRPRNRASSFAVRHRFAKFDSIRQFSPFCVSLSQPHRSCRFTSHVFAHLLLQASNQAMALAALKSTQSVCVCEMY